MAVASSTDMGATSTSGTKRSKIRDMLSLLGRVFWREKKRRRSRKRRVSFLRALLRIERVGNFVFKLRLFYWVKLRRRFQMFEDEQGVLSHQYSQDMLLKGRSDDRPLTLIRPLLAIEQVDRDSRILSIGCRFETELLYLVGYGFDPKRVRGLDMISYSPWIDVGNMHAMSYADDSWDVVMLPWVLSYSDQPEVVAQEVIRVTKDGGLVAIGVMYYPMEQLVEWEKTGQNAGIEPERRHQTVAAMVELFSPYVDRVFFSHDSPSESVAGICAVVFSIKKP